MQSKAKTNYRWLLWIAAIKLRGWEGDKGAVMKCIQLNNPRSNKMPNVFISTATLNSRDHFADPRSSKPNQSTYQHDHRNVCKTFILTSPHSKCTHTHTHTHNTHRQTETDRAVFAYSSDVNAKNFQSHLSSIVGGPKHLFHINKQFFKLCSKCYEADDYLRTIIVSISLK